MQETTERFDQHCLVELMGHARIAGRVTEETLFGAALMRVDVPETSHGAGYTRYFGASAIYSVTPVSEDVARRAAEAIDARPIQEWQLRPALPPPEDADVTENEEVPF